jgi:oxygen-independent coproporphyrinogen-3 oxidase
MTPDLITKYDARVPRYTSYPTAPHFHAGVDGSRYGQWLAHLDSDTDLSLYIHVPFCDTLCWFCGCLTTVVNRPEPIQHYMSYLLQEIDRVAEQLGDTRRVTHVHMGGGSPTILSPDQFHALFDRLRKHFTFADNVEIAVEVDPRGFKESAADALAEIGLTRASIGVQDLDPEVQKAVNRIQPFETTRDVVEMLRARGVNGLNIDLMYGLPHQTAPGTVATVQRLMTLAPDRVALFGYAHVPWMKKHQRLISEDDLPTAQQRLDQFDRASATLRDGGYVPIGLDHFAHPKDPMAQAHAAGELHRNFQGYTTDNAQALVGLGVSAIGGLPQGHAQNVKAVRDYAEMLDRGELPIERGIELTAEDRLRGDVIGRLMCDLTVDAAAVAREHGFDPAIFHDALDQLDDMVADGVVQRDGYVVTVPDRFRLLVRTAASAFDAYLQNSERRHATAV